MDTVLPTKKYTSNDGMRVIKQSNEAYNIAVDCLIQVKEKIPAIGSLSRIYKLPPEAKDSIWEISTIALENTLSYIYDYLQYTCYMVCVCGGKTNMYKLSGTETGSSYAPFIQKSIHMVQNNPTLTREQRTFITQKLSNAPLRLMQCIVKQYRNEAKYIRTNEYMELIGNLALCDGVYIFNLSDAVILRKDFKHPFPMVTGPVHLENHYKNSKFLPIFSISGQKGYFDIPIPNYDDVMFVLNKRPEISLADFNTDWASKIQKAVFRGSPTGCGYTEETNMRLKIATIQSQYLDAQITGKGETINTTSIRYDPKYGLGMLNTRIKPSDKFMSMVEQSNHKYIIHIDGNVNAYRLLTTMATGSLILRVESEYTSWVDHLLEPYVHYVPVKADLSNLITRIQFCMINDAKSRQIAKAGMAFARKMLTIENIQSIMQHLLCRDFNRKGISSKERVSPKYVYPVTPSPVPSPEAPKAPECPSGYKKVIVKGVEECVPKNKTRKSPPKKPGSPKEKGRTKKIEKTKEIVKEIVKDVIKEATKLPVAIEKEPVVEPVYEYEIMDFPAGKARCPKGYNSVTINGVKKCKSQTKTLKAGPPAPVQPVRQPVLPEKAPKAPTPIIEREVVAEPSLPKTQVKTAVPIPPIVPPKTVEVKSGDIIDFPAGKTRCPNGYKSVMVNGVKKCKKT